MYVRTFSNLRNIFWSRTERERERECFVVVSFQLYWFYTFLYLETERVVKVANIANCLATELYMVHLQAFLTLTLYIGGLVVRVPGYRSKGPSTTRFSEK
jgi:hypothetical protein